MKGAPEGFLAYTTFECGVEGPGRIGVCYRCDFFGEGSFFPLPFFNGWMGRKVTVIDRLDML
jgi:hypothetical protein